LIAFVREFRDPYPFWLFLAGVGITNVGGWWGHDQSLVNGIRYTGTILTVSGLLLVAHGLDETRSLFGKPTLTSHVFALGKRVVASV
jgi:hypothetical protein